MSKRLLLATLLLAASPALAEAGPVGSACLRSNRPAASPQVCSCIDEVAKSSLSRADQRQASRFFRDPDLAQHVRMHKSAAANDFWHRYKAFADKAQRLCS